MKDFVMKKFLSALCATALTASVAVTSALPASAAPAYVPKAPMPTAEHADVVNVQDYRWRRNRRGFDNDRFIRRGFDNDRRIVRRGDRYGWYNGHRGYRDWRRGYRYHDGFWFPAAAFLGGAIIGSAIANSQP